MEKKIFDGMFVFNVPVMIDTTPDHNTPPVPVLGFLYNTSEHDRPMFSTRIEMFGCYLLGVERLVSEGGKVIDIDTWMTGDGKVHNDINQTKKQLELYQRMKDSLRYKLYEFSGPLEWYDDEVVDGLILKQSLLDRCGVSFIENIDIHKIREVSDGGGNKDK